MYKLFYFLCLGFLFSACDDGDIITAELDFDNTFETCGELVFYKTKSNPDESLSIFINGLTIDAIIETNFVDTDSVYVALENPSITVNIDGSTNRFNYRTYSSLPNNAFCSDIPPSDLNITSDNSGTGSAVITTTLTEDDNDGIPAEFEDINGNGNLDDDDTDNDGIPNYLDDDDDGDNIKTANEEVNYTAALGLVNARDFDLDGIPDYLDNDDDGDGVPTRDEENLSTDLNPANDITNTEVGADYLNPDVATTVTAIAYRQHTITQNHVISIVVNNLSIPQLSQDIFIFGTLEDSSITTDSRNPKAIFN